MTGFRSILVHTWSDDILIVSLPPEPQTDRELDTIVSASTDSPECDLVLDFSRVDSITQATTLRMLRIIGLLRASGHCLAVCNTSRIVRSLLELHSDNTLLEELQTLQIAMFPPTISEAEGIMVLYTRGGIKNRERRHFVRIRIDSTRQIDVVLSDTNAADSSHAGQKWRGRLVDISDSGAQIAFCVEEAPCLDKETVVWLTINCEDRDLSLEAEIREALPTADSSSICLGVQFMNLQRDLSLRLAVRSLCDSLVRYYRTTQPSS